MNPGSPGQPPVAERCGVQNGVICTQGGKENPTGLRPPPLERGGVESHAENGVNSGTGGRKSESHAENGVNSGTGGRKTPSHAENGVNSGTGGKENPSGLRPPPLGEGRSRKDSPLGEGRSFWTDLGRVLDGRREGAAGRGGGRRIDYRRIVETARAQRMPSMALETMPPE